MKKIIIERKEDKESSKTKVPKRKQWTKKRISTEQSFPTPQHNIKDKQSTYRNKHEWTITLADLVPRFLVVASSTGVETTGSGVGQRSTYRAVKSLRRLSRTTFVVIVFAESESKWFRDGLIREVHDFVTYGVSSTKFHFSTKYIIERQIYVWFNWVYCTVQGSVGSLSSV